MKNKTQNYNYKITTLGYILFVSFCLLCGLIAYRILWHSVPVMGNFKNANVSQQTFYIYFEREGSSISDRQAEVLQKAVFDVKNNPEKFLYIEGNCSLQDGAYASETAAHTLALQRANTIADYFIKNGVSSGRIKVTENGNTRPTRELDNDRVDIYMRS